MTSVAGTIEQVAGELARLFAPLAARGEDSSPESFLAWLGLRPPDAVVGAADLARALSTSVVAAAAMPELIADLAKGIEEEDAGATGLASTSLIERIAELVHAAEQASHALDALSATPGLTPAQQAELGEFAGAFAERLLSLLFVEYVETRFPQLTLVLMAMGAVEIVDEPAGAAGSLKGAHTRKTIDFARMAKIFTDPAGLLREVYGWGDPGFDGLALFRSLGTLLEKKLQIQPELLTPPGAPAVLEAFGFSAAVNDGENPPGVDLSIRFPATLSRTESFNAGDWQVDLTLEAGFEADLTATIRPLFDVEITVPDVKTDVRVAVDVLRSAAAAPLFVLGNAGGSRLEVQGPGAGAALEVHFDAATTRAAIEPQLRGALHGGKLVISGEGGDSFIDKVLSGVNLESDFDVELTWSPSQGVAFVGSAALEIAIPVHRALGPLEILTLYLRAGLAADGGIPVELSGAFAFALGPLRASVDRLGLQATFTFPKGGGNLGPADVAFAFKPPNGVGLAVDAGTVKGGGYLYFDFENEEYAGALELTFADFVSLKAIGLITTKMPDGSNGFSLLVIITAEFGAGIQLGYGFTLIGVGGLLGLNREMRLEPLVQGVRTGSVDHIMFPRDVIANAPQIISDLKAFFPPYQGKFLIGPMAKLGWGTPTLISLALGIIIEIPGNIAILGVLRVALPTDDAAIIVLQVSFVGAIEFDKKRVYFFASLFESRVLFITIEGEMGLLVAFGDDADFVVSVGGFHPRFNPPPLPFPTPRRIALNILNESWARIGVDGYFAVTSNTVQFGAHAQLYFSLEVVEVEGQIGFDALIQFSPFYFIIQISASISLKVFGIGLFGIRLEFSLEGPTPWRARGTGYLQLLFWEVSANFDVTWGEAQDTVLPPVEVLPILLGELEKRDNWQALLPEGNHLLVTLRPLDPASQTLVLHPVGTLRISQKAIPLDLTLDKVGSQKPSDARRFSLEVAQGGLAKKSDASESFARAQFLNLDDASKLALPAYEPQHGGIELSAGDQLVQSSHVVARTVRYEEIVIDTGFRRSVKQFFVQVGVFLGGLFSHFLKGGALAKSPLSKQAQTRMKPYSDTLQAKPATYVIALQSNNQRYQATTFTSEASARERLAHDVASQPDLAGELHVIPEFEAEEKAA